MPDVSTMVSEIRCLDLARLLLWGRVSTESPMTVAAALATVALSALSVLVFFLSDRLLRAMV